MDWALGHRDRASGVALKVPVDSITRINICCNSHWTNTVAKLDRMLAYPSLG